MWAWSEWPLVIRRVCSCFYVIASIELVSQWFWVVITLSATSDDDVMTSLNNPISSPKPGQATLPQLQIFSEFASIFRSIRRKEAFSANLLPKNHVRFASLVANVTSTTSLWSNTIRHHNKHFLPDVLWSTPFICKSCPHSAEWVTLDQWLSMNGSFLD